MEQEKVFSRGTSGWRGHLGYVCPALLNSESVVEFHQMVPDGISMSIATLGITQLTPDQVERAISLVEDAAQRLSSVGVDFITVDGTPMVSIRGFGWDKELISRVEKIARVPATTSMTAAVDAFNTLGVKKIVMASPLSDEFNELARKFLEANGLKVIHMESLNIKASSGWRALPRSAAYTVGRKAYLSAPEAEGIYIPCGGWCNPQNIDCLERDFGKPVVQSKQATTWAFLKALKVREPVKGWGRIFETLY